MIKWRFSKFSKKDNKPLSTILNRTCSQGHAEYPTCISYFLPSQKPQDLGQYCNMNLLVYSQYPGYLAYFGHSSRLSRQSEIRERFSD